MRARGRAGHASVPALADNALLRLLPAVERLGAAGVAYDVTDEPRAFLEAIGEDPADPEGAVARVRAVDPRLAALLEPTLGATFAPTVIAASEKINVIPSRAEVQVDCRLPPGLGQRRRPAAASRSCSTATTASRSSPSRRWWGTARRGRGR